MIEKLSKTLKVLRVFLFFVFYVFNVLKNILKDLGLLWPANGLKKPEPSLTLYLE